MTATTIAGFARKGGVGVETVRYYQRRGLLEKPKRPSGAGSRGGVRYYSEPDLQRLSFIRSAQAAGFTLEQIKELLTLNAQKDRTRIRELAAERVSALNAQIAALQGARDALVRLSTECSSKGGSRCPIILAFTARGPNG